jgi:hypothetical protein
VAVFALGGYGRRELCLHLTSILVLFASAISADDEPSCMPS